MQSRLVSGLTRTQRRPSRAWAIGMWPVRSAQSCWQASLVRGTRHIGQFVQWRSGRAITLLRQVGCALHLVSLIAGLLIGRQQVVRRRPRRAKSTRREGCWLGAPPMFTPAHAVRTTTSSGVWLHPTGATPCSACATRRAVLRCRLSLRPRRSSASLVGLGSTDTAGTCAKRQRREDCPRFGAHVRSIVSTVSMCTKRQTWGRRSLSESSRCRASSCDGTVQIPRRN